MRQDTANQQNHSWLSVHDSNISVNRLAPQSSARARQGSRSTDQSRNPASSPEQTLCRVRIPIAMSPDRDAFVREIEAERRAAAETLEAERRTAQELEIAKRVQARLFPQTLPQLKTLRKGDRKAALLVNPYY